MGELKVMPDEDRPRLDFFRVTPADMASHPPLASSLQSFETCLYLIGSRRYPIAVVSCVNALESAIKAKLGIPPDDRRIQLRELLTTIRSRFPELNNFDPEKIVALRDRRNRLVHYGFSPKDDPECAVLLLEVGIPFLNLCYQIMFDFYLDWQDIRPGVDDFMTLTSAEASKAGLLPAVAEQLRFVANTYRSAKGQRDFKPEWSFHSFVHYINFILKQSAMSESEANSFEYADSNGINFDREMKVRRSLEIAFRDSCVLDCPICDGVGTLIVELEYNTLSEGEISPDRCGCVQCGFVVWKGAPHISRVLLAGQIAQVRERLLKEYGLIDTR
jgi:hypothetical protein